MAKGKGYALVIISLIIGSIGVGMGVYSILNFSPPEDLDEDGMEEGSKVVGLWENITGDYGWIYNLEFDYIQINKSDYFTLTDNWNITLTREGYYRFYIRFQWTSLQTWENYELRFGDTQLVNLNPAPAISYEVEEWRFVYSDGDDSFYFRCANNALNDGFSVSTVQSNNQFVLEYVGETQI